MSLYKPHEHTQLAKPQAVTAWNKHPWTAEMIEAFASSPPRPYYVEPHKLEANLSAWRTWCTAHPKHLWHPCILRWGAEHPK